MNNYEVKSSEKWVALFLCVLSSVILNIPYLGYSTAIPQIMADLNINYTQASYLSSSTAIVSGFAVLFGGVIADKWGPTKAIVLSLFLLTIGQLAFALMPTYSLILGSRIFIGLGVTLIYAGTMAVTVRWFENTGKMGLGVGFLLSSDGIGSMVGLYLFAYVITWFGWRIGSVIGAGLVIAVCIICFFLLKEHPSYYAEQTVQKASKDAASNEPKESYFYIVLRKNVIIAACFIIGYIGGYSVVVYWVPTILIEQGWSEGLAGFIGALYAFVGILGAVSSGAISDKLGRRKPLVLISGLCMAFSFILSAYAVSTGNYTMLAIMLPLAGLSAYIGSPNVYCWAADAVGVKNVGTANGFILACGFLIGGSLFPTGLGLLKDASGSYSLGFIACAGAVILLNLIIPLFADEKIQPALKHHSEIPDKA
ncbi:MAG: MFS transporter [Dehalobacterium sp.]